MSLRGRLLLIALVVIVAVIACVQAFWLVAQDRWARESLPEFHNHLYKRVLHYAYDPAFSDGVDVVRRIMRIGPEQFRTYFRDVLIANGPSPEIRGSVDLNPMGASHRDPATFPLDEIRGGIRDAVATRLPVLAGGGYCLPIESQDEVVGGAWFEPIVPAPPRLPLTSYLLPITIGALVFGAIAYGLIERGVVKPLSDLGAAAVSVGQREAGVRVPHLAGVRELDRLIDAFNRMVEEVEGHRGELEREVRRATETAERRQAVLLRSARLAAMGTLAAGIAHEINNPIGGMINAVRRIGESGSLGDRDRRYVVLIQEGLERVARIARRVLDFSPREIDAHPFELARAIEGARGLADHRFRTEGVELRLDLADGLPPLVGDAHEFQQVLLNVFINSLDVFVGQPEPRWIEVRGRFEEPFLVIEIEDNGPGMPREELARVMDPFFSAKGRPDASGLGMFISHQIVENHGGEFEVDSPPGRGFVVTIRMPVEESDGE